MHGKWAKNSETKSVHFKPHYLFVLNELLITLLFMPSLLVFLNKAGLWSNIFELSEGHWDSLQCSRSFSRSSSIFQDHSCLNKAKLQYRLKVLVLFIKLFSSILLTTLFFLVLLSYAPAHSWYTTAAKLLQSRPTLCDPIDGSPTGSFVPGILQARILEYVAISFNAWKWKVKVKSLSRVGLLTTPWTVAVHAPPSMGFSRQEYWSGLPLLLLLSTSKSVAYSYIRW